MIPCHILDVLLPETNLDTILTNTIHSKDGIVFIFHTDSDFNWICAIFNNKFTYEVTYME